MNPLKKYSTLAVMKTFEKTIEVRWADVDQNMHVRHSAYYDYGAFTRVKFFSENGFDSNQMTKLSIGPILFKEECTFLREIKPEETITVNLKVGTCSDDLTKWELHHEIFKQDGTKAAHITAKGSWLDLQKRKIATPPKEIIALFNQLPKGEAFVYQKK